MRRERRIYKFTTSITVEILLNIVLKKNEKVQITYNVYELSEDLNKIQNVTINMTII